MKRSLSVIVFGVLFFIITITGVKAETFDGEYTTEYLLRNYNVVTFGDKTNSLISSNPKTDSDCSIYLGYGSDDDYSIAGAILSAGDFRGYGQFGDEAGNVKSYIKGSKDNTILAPDNLVIGDNYIDFDKMYLNVKNESQLLVEKAKKHINSGKLEVSSPGIYTVDNTATIKKTDGGSVFDRYGGIYSGDYYYNDLLINNYDKNALYVFNYLNEYVAEGTLPTIFIMENGSANAINLKDYYESGEYTGNIIFNFPNAKEIRVVMEHLMFTAYDNSEFVDFENSGFSASIIAPSAYIRLINNYGYHFYYFGSIIASKVEFSNYLYDYRVKKANYNINQKLIEDETNSYMVSPVDYDDDYYSRDYSIRDLLQNYSLVTLGQNEMDTRTKLSRNNLRSGSIRLFHITGQSLINGDMYFNNRRFKTAFDLESNKVTESFINGEDVYGYSDHDTYTPSFAIQPWDNMTNDRINYVYQKNSLLLSKYPNVNPGFGNCSGFIDDYLNFERLYDNIVAEQKEIQEGTKVKKGEDNKIHLRVGGTYTIDDINDVNEIIFDNFEDNKDKLTIITVKNSGDVNFPLMSKDSGDYRGIVTNDYYGKSEATHFYEEDTFVQDTYHGNIVWNLPNATYVKLKGEAPFAGHLIAPNADVETEETHFAGCFIVNSIYGEGNTEAHFYPLTVKACDCDDYNALPTRLKEAADNYYLSKKLGGDSSIIETEFVGDRNQYNDDVSKFDNILAQCKIIDNNNSSSNGNSIVDILTNPLTANNIILFVVLGSIVGGSIYLIRKRKSKK